MQKHIVTDEEYEATKEVAKRNKNKRVEKRLQVILLRHEGKKDKEIGEKLGYSRKRISQLCAEFKRVGLSEYARHKYGGNRRAVPKAEEAKILNEFREKAEAGTVVTVQDIKGAFDKRRNKDTDRGYIYMLLRRHGWRMVMPRGKHPKKASDEAIEASKKLTLRTMIL
jgi:transposase